MSAGMPRTTVDVAVVGAGLAGLAAASALSRAGAGVVLCDRRPFVGGRAYSYPLPAVAETVDSQHVLLGCCTNLRELCRRAGADHLIRWYRELNFLEPGGPRSVIGPSLLPAPLHNSVSFLRAPMLTLGDKAGIANGLREFVLGYPDDDDESVSSWLRRSGQTERAIQHFWRPIIIGALNDSFDRCSLKYAGQVFHESFIKSAEAGWLGIPAVPLSDLYGHVADDAAAHGACVLLKSGVASVRPDGDMWRLSLADGEMLSARSVVLAVAFDQLPSLLTADDLQAAAPGGLDRFIHAPITTVHLWFDREITDLDHAVLLDTTIEWIFHKSRIRQQTRGGSYVELTISASHRQLQMSREEILTDALRELAMFFPSVSTAGLVKHAVLKEAKATFSVVPGLDAFRPAQQTAVEGLFLAGDWTRTGWPSTMEGAARSGFLAAEGVARRQGMRAQFLAPDLPPAGMMRLLARQ